MKSNHRLIKIVAFGILCLTSSPLLAGNYRIIDLGLPSADFRLVQTATGINNKGQVIGNLNPQFGIGFGQAAFFITPDNGVWFRDDNADGYNDLMEVILPPANFNSLFVNAINDSGQIVGRLVTKSTFGSNGFLWDDGVLTVLDPQDSSSVATGINNEGQISGHSAGEAVVWSKSLSKTVLGRLPNAVGTPVPNAINGLGEVVGWQRVSGNQRAVLWRNSTPIDLGTLGGDDAVANAINDSSQVVGRSKIRPGSFDRHAFLWESNTMRDIGAIDRPPHGNARDINNKGQVVAALGFGTSFLWLPKPAYGLTAGAHFIPRLPSTSLGAIHDVAAINDDGLIIGWGKFGGIFKAFLMVPPPAEGIIVNTVGDAPDSDPTDTVCSTGNFAANGQPECTMRAAIMEANAQAGLDTILFDIPGTGIPVIKVGTELPEITEEILIDGAAQPGAGRVELDGSLALSANGLTVSSGNSEIRHLLINNFAGNGLVLLTGGDNAIGNLSIGIGPGSEKRGNDGHGIYILSSSNNIIGSPVLSRRNIIAYNGQSGVFVESGTGNIIRDNTLFENAGLGIDLAPRGVTRNDPGDGDGGANGLQNSPAIDSVDVGLVTTIWGTINTIGGRSYEIDIYVSDSCDASGFGEGKTLIQSAPIFVDADGTTEFEIKAVTTPFRGQYLTATATDRDGNTSEFSLCVSANYVRLVDVNRAPILFNKFALFTVANDPPAFTETFVDTVRTGEFGIVDLTKYDIPSRKLLRFSRQLSSTLSPKRATTPKSALSVNLDNAKFDSSSSQMSYFETTDDMVQVVEMTHTTVSFNLYVSIEFDATVAYVNNLQNAFRLASNYLYDVTDGQARLDTVVITDNGAGWNIADVWVHASNMEWPRAVVNGLLTNGRLDRFHMPRKFYGNKAANRNQSAIENPLNTATPNSYRTFIHELGHYALGFFDEYVFTNALGKCFLISEYGFMENQYPGGIPRSEMSTASEYFFSSCQNTAQFARNGASCWESFELAYQKVYGGVRAPIIKPDERSLPSGSFNLLGPNDNLSAPDVNVGARVVFPGGPHGAPGLPPKRYKLFAADGTTPAGDVEVTQNIVASGKSIKQGKTADDGRIYFMGAPSAYTYTAAGVSRATAATGSRVLAPGDFSWSFGEGVLPAQEDDSIFLSDVQGELPLIPSVSLTSSGIDYRLKPLNQLIANPSVLTTIDDQFVDSSALIFDGNVYRATVSDTSSATFDFTVHASDNASNKYFFGSAVSVGAVNSSGSVSRTAGSQGNFTLSLDSSSAAEKQVILTTDYPPIRNGLTPTQIQAGKVGAMQTFPSVTRLLGFNTLQIRYPEGNSAGNGIDSTLEFTLRIHHWDDVRNQWISVGGTVDTANNEVFAQIYELGTYALFTTDIQTDVDDEETGTVLPEQFELHQNYPNPFNPTTTIAYSLPHRAEVTVTIYNILGEVVRVFDEGMKSAGRHAVSWNSRNADGKSVASGVYFYKVEAGKLVASRKMLLLK